MRKQHFLTIEAKKIVNDCKRVMKNMLELGAERAELAKQEEEKWVRDAERKQICALLENWLRYLAERHDLKIFEGTKPRVFCHDGIFYCVAVRMRDRAEIDGFEREYERLYRYFWTEFINEGVQALESLKKRDEEYGHQYDRICCLLREKGWLLEKVWHDASVETDRLRQARFSRELDRLREEADGLKTRGEAILREKANTIQEYRRIELLIGTKITPVAVKHNRQAASQLFLFRL